VTSNASGSDRTDATLTRTRLITFMTKNASIKKISPSVRPCSACPSVCPCVHPSVDPVPPIFSKWKSRRNFQFSENIALDKSN